jgi:hypothetical protein
MSPKRRDRVEDFSGDGPGDLADLSEVDVDGSAPDDPLDDDFLDDDWEPDFADDADSHEAAALPTRSRKGAVSVAFLNAGLALEEIVYGRERSKPPVVQEAREGDDDGPIRVHLDPEEPKNSWVSLHPEEAQADGGADAPTAGSEPEA